MNDLEEQRHNTVRSRNLRLTALRAFLKFAARRDVSSLHVIERALGVPMKRFERPMLGFLSREEMLAVIGEPGSTWTSQRDHLLLAMLYNTGARVSEMIGVRVADVVLDAASCLHLHGKVANSARRPMEVYRTGGPGLVAANRTLGLDAPLLPNRDGKTMTRSNVTQRLDIAVARAAKVRPQLAKRNVSPHTIRHDSHASTAVGCGIQRDRAVAGSREHDNNASLCGSRLGDESESLGPTSRANTKKDRYRPPDTLIQFLQTL